MFHSSNSNDLSTAYLKVSLGGRTVLFSTLVLLGSGWWELGPRILDSRPSKFFSSGSDLVSISGRLSTEPPGEPEVTNISRCNTERKGDLRRTCGLYRVDRFGRRSVRG